MKSLPRRLKHCVLTTNSEAAYYSTQYGMGHAVSRMLVQSTFNRFDKHMVNMNCVHGAPPKCVKYKYITQFHEKVVTKHLSSFISHRNVYYPDSHLPSKKQGFFNTNLANNVCYGLKGVRHFSEIITKYSTA